MDKRNVVGQAVFDIRFDSAALAAAHQESLATLIRTELLQVLDEVFSAAEPADDILSLDSLELDLGRVEYSTFRDELPRRLRTRLAERLGRHQLSSGQGAAEEYSSRRLSPHHKQAEMLRFFLLHGFLPWHREEAGMSALEAAFLRSLRDSDQLFVHFIRQTNRRDIVLERIVNQFSPPAVLELLRAFRPDPQDLPPAAFCDKPGETGRRQLLNLLLEAVGGAGTPQPLPSHLAQLLRRALHTGQASDLYRQWPQLLRDFAPYLREALILHGRQAIIRRRIAEGFPETIIEDILVLLEPTEAVFLQSVTQQPELFGHTVFAGREERLSRKRLMWEFTLGYLLEVPGSLFNRKSYLGSLARQMANHGNLDLSELLGNMQEMLIQLEMPVAMKTELMGLLHELIEESGSVPGKITAADSVEEQEGAQQHSRELGELLRHGSTTALLEYWQSLKGQYPSLLRDICFQVAAEQTMRRHMVERLQESIIREMLSLLAPGEASFIEQIVEHPQLFTQAVPGPRQDETTGKKYLWELTLEYLVEERGSAFNQRAYMRHLVRQMAIRQSLDQQELLQSVYGVLAEMALSTPLRLQLMTLLGELLDETSPSAEPSRVEQTSKEKGSLLRAAAYSDALLRHLSRPGESGRAWPLAEQTPTALAELAAHYPEMLLDVLQGLRDTPFLQFNRAHRLTTDAILHLIDVLLAFIHHTDQERRAGFLNAVTEWALRSGNPHGYLSLVLEQLIRNQPIDCEALFEEQKNSTGEAPEVKPPQASTSPDPGDPLSEADLTVELERVLEQATITGTARESLRRRIERFADRNAQWLQRLIQRSLGDHRLDRLIDLLPNHLLLSAVLSSDSTQLVALVRNAVLLAAIMPLLGDRIDRQLVRRKKWRFLLFWAFQRQSGQTLPEALDEFVGHLRRLAGWDDRFPLVEQLRQLSKKTDPSLAAQVESLCQTLSPHQSALPASSPSNTPSFPASLVWSLEHEEEPLESVFVANAGLVLASPYLPRLFALLGLLQNNLLSDAAAAQRAVHLLQYMVTGITASSEPLLVLNKILCGLDPETPVVAEIELSDREKETAEGLIGGIISNWTVLGATSVAGFRESFLQRQGMLQLKENNWHLLVEPRAYDLLLEQIPWSFSVIKHPWMTQSIQVDWPHGL